MIFVRFTTRFPEPDAHAINTAMFALLDSADPIATRRMVDAVNDFTRIRMREDGFLRRIMPLIPLTNDQLDRSVETNLPVHVVDAQEQEEANDFAQV